MTTKLTNGDSSPNDLLDVKERAKSVEKLQHHHCTTKLFMRNNTAHWSGLWEGLWSVEGGRGNTGVGECVGGGKEIHMYISALVTYWNGGKPWYHMQQNRELFGIGICYYGNNI